MNHIDSLCGRPRLESLFSARERYFPSSKLGVWKDALTSLPHINGILLKHLFNFCARDWPLRTFSCVRKIFSAHCILSSLVGDEGRNTYFMLFTRSTKMVYFTSLYNSFSFRAKRSFICSQNGKFVFFARKVFFPSTMRALKNHLLGALTYVVVPFVGTCMLDKHVF